MSEDYTRSRTLCSFEYLGESFRIVRRRLRGKPWPGRGRGYLMLLHDNVPMTADWQTDPDKALAVWSERTKRAFKTREELKKAIAEQKQRLAA